MASLLVPTSAFILLFFLISLTPTTVTSAVLDVNGKFVTNRGGRYYMIPYENPIGAGPITWVNNTKSCPLSVTKQPFTKETRYSSITLFSPFLSEFIPVGSPIAIKFNDVDTPCDKPLWWFIKPSFDLETHFLDMAAGNTDVSSFALVIEDAKIKGRHVYQLKYCEYKNEDGECIPVVVKPDNSGLLGVIYDLPNGLRPFQFEFVKATFPSLAREI